MPIVEAGANIAFVEAEFGGPVTNLQANYVIGRDVVRVADNNPECLSANIINLGSSSCFIAPDNHPSSTHGILLAANGGFLSLNVRDDQLLPSLSWYAVAPEGGANIYILRLARYSQSSSMRIGI